VEDMYIEVREIKRSEDIERIEIIVMGDMVRGK
jgi:hypothetical protein